MFDSCFELFPFVLCFFLQVKTDLTTEIWNLPLSSIRVYKDSIKQSEFSSRLFVLKIK